MKIITMILFVIYCYADNTIELDKNYTILKELNKDITFKLESEVSLKTLYINSAEGIQFTIKDENDKKLALTVSKHGSLDRYKFYFKYSKDKKYFELEKSYYLLFNKSCDHSLNAIFELKSTLFDNIFFKTFNKIDLNKLLNTPLWINKEIELEKIKSQEFLSSYNKIINKYKNKLNFKDDVENLLVYSEDKCEPKYYINYKYFFEEDINKSNDIAFFFEQAGYFKESIYLLEKILEKYPKRTVAYLNIADAYWGDNNKDKAIENYKIYISQMKENGKETKIPKRVFERINIKDIKKILFQRRFK